MVAVMPTTFCDSSGVTAIATAQRKEAAHSGQLRVASESAQVLRVLELTGLDRIVAVFASRDEAPA